ncbi:DUF4350 domain-containing protein [Mucilaginibacter sp. SP1R1]|uniref:DUF4350 domain-containing protein n=1 Tax=Mucilaginibacter sp. SP1R1 TaxID=2723091 RepID=UPI00160E4813|nr:DUF4350 domain-containing protein [Mucilaginibacter sp. SP1R1]MBB6151248.1 hypothetical protein [Mucilaginibacter sp. SP1R1]
MKDLKIYIIIATALFTIYVVANINRPKPVNWAETFSDTDKIPFGTYIVHDRARDLFPGAAIKIQRLPIYNVLTDTPPKQASYIIICGGIDMSKPDYEQLVKYIGLGNDVFIAATDFGSLFEKNLHISTKADFNIQQQNTAVKFLNPALHPESAYLIDRGSGNFYFNKFDTLKAVALGDNVFNKANFIKYRFGKGNLYLMSNPKMLSNYSMLNKQGALYAATALSYIKNTKQIIWDEYYTRGSGESKSPMKVFLNTPQLQWAYYISIFSLLAFVLFEIKRRQRIIPVVEPLQNSTLDFVTVVGQVYYEKRDNVNIAHKKVLYLLAYIRDHYRLKTNMLDQEFADSLAKKTGINVEFATKLTNALNFVSTQQRITDWELINLNKLIENFYRQSGYNGK